VSDGQIDTVSVIDLKPTRPCVIDNKVPLPVTASGRPSALTADGCRSWLLQVAAIRRAYIS
jgi:hypothetical protein